MYQKINAIIRPWSRLWFPALCTICRVPLVQGERHICLRCQHHWHRYTADGLLPDPKGKFYLPVDPVVSMFIFQRYGKAQEILHTIKYGYGRDLARRMGEKFGAEIRKKYQLQHFDALIPVPQHWRRHWKRGHNQAVDFAWGLSEELSLPLDLTVLRAGTYRKTQTLQGKLGRWESVKGRYSRYPKAQIRGRSFLLVDDIITTGATTEACAAVLFENGARAVGICALALAE